MTAESLFNDPLSLSVTTKRLMEKAADLNDRTKSLNKASILVEQAAKTKEKITIRFYNRENGDWETIEMEATNKAYEPTREIIMGVLKGRLDDAFVRYEAALDAFGERKGVADE